MSDDRGRPCVGDYLRGRKERLFHVGRLDADTEGLLLLTNDGELAQRLAHPSHGVTKTYLAQVRGTIPRDLGRRLREGVELEDGIVRVDRFRVVTSAPGRGLVELVLHEGRKHVVRRLLEEVGHPVEGWCGSRSARSGSATCGRAAFGAHDRQEVGELYNCRPVGGEGTVDWRYLDPSRVGRPRRCAGRQIDACPRWTRQEVVSSAQRRRGSARADLSTSRGGAVHSTTSDGAIPRLARR